MRIGIIDVDSHNYPNIPLMKISAWHKAKGDSVEWYNSMSWLNPYDKVYMSKVFSFTPDYEYPIYAKEVEKGGSGYCIETVDGVEIYNKANDKELPHEIEHIYPDYSLYPEYTKDTAYGFLTRGCPRGCDFCHVKAKEGQRSIKVADLSEFWNGQKNIVLNDPNILGCADRIELLEQLKDSGSLIEFNQGLDIRLINNEVLDVLKDIKIKTIHFAIDQYKDIDLFKRQAKLVKDVTGWNRSKVMVYILCNFETTLEQDVERIQLCRQLDWQPYVMIYDKEHADKIYKHLQRWCSPFIFWKCENLDDYTKVKESKC